MNAAQKTFLVVFVLSTLGILALSTNLITNFSAPAPSLTEGAGTEPTPVPEHPEVDPSAQDSEKIGYTALIGTVLTSITSLVGFVTTTVITVRKEKREATLADVQRQKLETELEKSRFELEKLKKSRTKKREKK